MALESEFQRKLKKEIKDRFPGCYVLKNDPSFIDCIPDLLILYKDKWAALEVKRDAAAVKKSLRDKPKQGYYVNELNKLSYASFVYPENKEDVLNDLERTFKTARNTCDV